MCNKISKNKFLKNANAIIICKTRKYASTIQKNVVQFEHYIEYVKLKVRNGYSNRQATNPDKRINKWGCLKNVNKKK